MIRKHRGKRGEKLKRQKAKRLTISCKPFLIWCPDPELNQGHEDFQSSALPTELSGQFEIYDLKTIVFQRARIIAIFIKRGNRFLRIIPLTKMFTSFSSTFC